jgi:hypothetical protein
VDSALPKPTSIARASSIDCVHIVCVCVCVCMCVCVCDAYVCNHANTGESSSTTLLKLTSIARASSIDQSSNRVQEDYKN